MTSTNISFEFYPPRKSGDAAVLLNTVKQLSALDPALITLTFGAGGSAYDETPRLLGRFRQHTDAPLASHLTHLRLPKAALNDYLDKMWDMGIRHIVALRGDIPKDMPPRANERDYYRDTPEFIAGIKERHPFTIIVAAYPEKHPEAADLRTDVQFLKRKFDAGADYAFTQLFFDNDNFYRFMDMAGAEGIVKPITPGLLPFRNFTRTSNFATKIGAQIPPFLSSAFGKATEKDHPAIATHVLMRQIVDLKYHGFGHFHFYTMNSDKLIRLICELAEITPQPAHPFAAGPA